MVKENPSDEVEIGSDEDKVAVLANQESLDLKLDEWRQRIKSAQTTSELKQAIEEIRHRDFADIFLQKRIGADIALTKDEVAYLNLGLTKLYFEGLSTLADRHEWIESWQADFTSLEGIQYGKVAEWANERLLVEGWMDQLITASPNQLNGFFEETDKDIEAKCNARALKMNLSDEEKETTKMLLKSLLNTVSLLIARAKEVER